MYARDAGQATNQKLLVHRFATLFLNGQVASIDVGWQRPGTASLFNNSTSRTADAWHRSSGG